MDFVGKENLLQSLAGNGVGVESTSCEDIEDFNKSDDLSVLSDDPNILTCTNSALDEDGEAPSFRSNFMYTTNQKWTVSLLKILDHANADHYSYNPVGGLVLSEMCTTTPAAFMQVRMEGKRTVHMKLKGKMAELMVQIDPKMYRKYIQMENGRMVLYKELEKALYGTLTGAFLFWKKLSKQLVKRGFVLNPYDSCVAIKIINGKQCTILWHVNDLKISHVDPKVVDDMIKLLKSEFGKEAPLTISRGKVHEYLGMTIDFRVKGKVKFMMIDYIENVITELPADMSGTVRSPASSHLFNVNDDAEKLSTKLSDFFHHNVATLLFLCQAYPTGYTDSSRVSVHSRKRAGRGRLQKIGQDYDVPARHR